MSQPRDKRNNEQLDVPTALVSEELATNQLVEAEERPINSPAPGLVEKLIQQLNDLKEMVCVYII